MTDTPPTRTVGDYVTLQRGTTYSGTLVGKPGPALLGLGSITPGGGFRPDFKTFGGDCPAKLLLGPGDIYVALKGATKDGSMVGSVARVPPTLAAGRLTQDTARLDFKVKDPEVIDYIYWLLRTPQYREYCDGRVTGSASASFSRDDFLAYQVPTLRPDLAKIVGVLEATEEKIDLNRRTNETLESMARTLFRSWFVDFDPVRSKADGQKPFGLDAATVKLFPDTFEPSALGPIPKGWRVKPIGEVVEVVGGSTPSTDEPSYWNGPHQFATPKDMAALSSPVLLTTERTITAEGLERISSGLLAEGTVLMSSRAPIGYLAITEVPVAVNQGFVAMKCPDGMPNQYVLHWARENMNEIIAHANGTTFLEISKTNFRPLKALVPEAKVLKAFADFVSPLHQRVVANLRESVTLAATRDALLPKLLSGEVATA